MHLDPKNYTCLSSYIIKLCKKSILHHFDAFCIRKQNIKFPSGKHGHMQAFTTWIGSIECSLHDGICLCNVNIFVMIHACTVK